MTMPKGFSRALWRWPALKKSDMKKAAIQKAMARAWAEGDFFGETLDAAGEGELEEAAAEVLLEEADGEEGERAT